MSFYECLEFSAVKAGFPQIKLLNLVTRERLENAGDAPEGEITVSNFALPSVPAGLSSSPVFKTTY